MGRKLTKGENAFLIGLDQELAIIPVISRSGTTIAGAMHLGIKKEEAIRFSFLLAIPALLGATILKIGKVSVSINMNMVIGFLVSTIVSYFVLNWLIKLVRKNKLRWFSYYCFILGSGMIIYSLVW